MSKENSPISKIQRSKSNHTIDLLISRESEIIRTIQNKENDSKELGSPKYNKKLDIFNDETFSKKLRTLHLEQNMREMKESYIRNDYDYDNENGDEDIINEEDIDDKFNLEDYKEQNAKYLKDTEAKESSDNNLEVIPPENFSHVIGEIYRSSFPRIENFYFLSQRLRLKSILVLIPEEYPQENIEFLEESNIKLFQVGMSGNKEPFVNLPSNLLTKALEIVINPENQPILIHCNRGKHRTGCLIGCIRKLQNWSLTMIFDEYRRFAFPKARALDQQFIEMYDDKEIKEIATENNWLPLQW